MSNGRWGGDLNAAKEFHSKVVGTLDDDRRGRGGARGGRGGSNMTRGGNSFANSASFTNNGAGRRGGLLTELPSHFWHPVNNHGIQDTQAANAEDRGDPMNIDDRSMGGSQGASDPSSAAETGTGSVPTPASWGNTGSSQSGLPRRSPPSPVRTNAPESSRSATREQITWGPRNTPDVQDGKITPHIISGAEQATASATEAGRQWPGLNASRHAGYTDPAGSTIHKKQYAGVRRDLLQENGMLKGVQFTEDHGPQQDDDWLKTYNLNKVKDKCVSVANQAFAAGDNEAERALRKVITACNDVLHAKNELRDKKVEHEADKTLSNAQKEAWVHWIKFYRPTAPAADSASVQAPNESPNVRMQDAPAVVASQIEQVQVPRSPIQTRAQAQAQASPATAAPFASAQASAAPQRPSDDSGSFGSMSFQQQPSRAAKSKGFDYTPSGSFDSSNSQQLHDPIVQQTQASQQSTRSAQLGNRNPSGGFGSANVQKANATAQQPQPAQRSQGAQHSTELSGLPSMFPKGLPAGFDDPQARQIFEDFFFQNKRLR